MTMRTITAKYPGPITLELDLFGDIHISVENRRFAEIVLDPVDRNAARMIEDVRVEHSRGYLGAFMGNAVNTGMSVVCDGDISLIGGLLLSDSPVYVNGRRARSGTSVVSHGMTARIRLPLDSSLTARTNGNSLVVSGRLDAAEVKCNGGDIRLDSVGRLEARTNGGSVNARAVTHLIEANCNGGSISVHAVADLQAYVKANGGSVHITAGYGVRVDSHIRRHGGSVRVP
jgi:hypothetical protein